MSGPQCCSNPPTLNPSSRAGHVEKLGGLDSYVTGSPNSQLAIVLISDLYGYQAPNLRNLADKVAAAGFYVVVPDFLHGDPYVPEDSSRPIHVWIKDHGTDGGFEEAKVVIDDLKNKGFSAIGAAGFCWGGSKSCNGALSKVSFIQAGVILHPVFVTVDDCREVKVPMAILGAETDHLTPPELVKQFEEVLSEKPEVERFVKIFEGVAHGWTMRYKLEDEATRKRAEEAHQDLIQWFTKHVK